LDELEGRLRAARRGPIFDASLLTPVDLGPEDVRRLLPHRGRMLLVDRIHGVDPVRGRIAASRLMDPGDPVFEGHFPGDPVYPGALQIESAGQCGLCLRHFVDGATVDVPADTRPAPVRLLRVLEASFIAPVRPGDTATLLAEVLENDGYTFFTLGQMLVDGRPASACAFEVMILEDDG
jgi:3-hydroxymyristoyl/3-hydroxydecanoyl-(acyl carrier protein) dehydratase